MRHHFKSRARRPICFDDAKALHLGIAGVTQVPNGKHTDPRPLRGTSRSKLPATKGDRSTEAGSDGTCRGPGQGDRLVRADLCWINLETEDARWRTVGPEGIGVTVGGGIGIGVYVLGGVTWSAVTVAATRVITTTAASPPHPSYRKDKLHLKVSDFCVLTKGSTSDLFGRFQLRQTIDVPLIIPGVTLVCPSEG